jgi:hypothetical protein
LIWRLIGFDAGDSKVDLPIYLDSMNFADFVRCDILFPLVCIAQTSSVGQLLKRTVPTNNTG